MGSMLVGGVIRVVVTPQVGMFASIKSTDKFQEDLWSIYGSNNTLNYCIFTQSLSTAGAISLYCTVPIELTLTKAFLVVCVPSLNPK